MGITQDTPSRDPDPARDFDLLYERFRLPVYRVIRGVVLDRDAAERLTQEAFERAYETHRRRRPTDAAAEPPQVWLFRVAVEAAFRYVHRSWWSRLGLDRLLRTDTSTREQATRSAAERVLWSLSPRHRAVVVLSFYARLSGQEMARVLQLPEAVVRVQLEFATELMRAALSATDQPSGRERL